MYQNIPTKCLTGEVRLSYAHLVEPYANPAQPNAKPKYSVTLLIPKTDIATKADMDAAIEAAAVEATSKKWNGYRPPALKSVIHDGDGVRQDGTPYGDECKGCWVVTANSGNKPQVVDISNIRCELAPQDIYSGMYARVTVNFSGYSNSGNKGVGCYLGNVMKTRDGEPLSGGASAESDFSGIGQCVEAPGAAATYSAGGVVPAGGITGGGQVNPITGLPM